MRLQHLLSLTVAALLIFSTTAPHTYAQTPADSCTGKTTVPTGTTEAALDSGGLEREYRVYIPPGYDPAQPTPLVLTLHGFAGSAAQQQADSGWDAVAERENFIAVYPHGTGAPARWNAGQNRIAELEQERRGLLGDFLGGFFESVPTDDVAFIRDLLIALQADYCIDPARIYVNGLSNGGGMTNRLACELADQIAAVGMVAGAYTEFPEGCNPSRPVPVIAFHGVLDPIVPYAGDAEINFPAVEDWAADWAARNECNPASESIPDTVGAVTGWRYTDCAGDAEVVFYSIADGGHTWPGGSMGMEFLIGKTSTDIAASETMWVFFQAYPLPQS